MSSPQKLLYWLIDLSAPLIPCLPKKKVLKIHIEKSLKSGQTKGCALKRASNITLGIKAQATVSKDLFEMALYSPGTPFDKEVMEAETMEGDRTRVLCSNMPSVKLCLVPASHVYDHDRKLWSTTTLYNDQAAADQGL